MTDYIKLFFWLIPISIIFLVGVSVGVTLTTIFFRKVVDSKDEQEGI